MVTGLVMGCAPGTVTGAGVVTGLVMGTSGGIVTGVVEGMFESGLAGVMVTGFVEGTVTIVGVGLLVGRVTGVVDIGVVGGSMASRKLVLNLLSICLLEEGNISSSSSSSSLWTESSIKDTSAYSSAIWALTLLLSKDFETVLANSATCVAEGKAEVLISRITATSLQGRREAARVALSVAD